MDERPRWPRNFPSSRNNPPYQQFAWSHAACEDRLRCFHPWAARGVRAWHEGWWGMAVETGSAWPGRALGLVQLSPPECDDHPGDPGLLLQLTWPPQQDRDVRPGISLDDLFLSGTTPATAHALRSFAPGIVADSDGQIVAGDRRTDPAGADLTGALSLRLWRSSASSSARISRSARSVGLIQAAGTMPVDVRALDADFATGGVLSCAAGLA